MEAYITYNIKQGDEELVEQRDICLTNVLLQCYYPQGQLDCYKVAVPFNVTKYFVIKQYVQQQPLTVTCQTLLRKCKAHERSLVFYKRVRVGETATTAEALTTTVALIIVMQNITITSHQPLSIKHTPSPQFCRPGWHWPRPVNHSKN